MISNSPWSLDQEAPSIKDQLEDEMHALGEEYIKKACAIVASYNLDFECTSAVLLHSVYTLLHSLMVIILGIKAPATEEQRGLAARKVKEFVGSISDAQS